MRRETKLSAIKTDLGYFIRNEDSYGYQLEKVLINGESPKPTFNKRWFLVGSKPQKVEIWVDQPSINYRYELKDKSFASEKVKAVLVREVAADLRDYEWIWKPEYAHLESLYELKWDEQPRILEEVPFELSILAETKELRQVNGFSYPAIGFGMFGNDKGTITQDHVIYPILDTMIFPDIVLPTRPCSLSSQDSYRIVREYVKTHINPKYAEITSDYDFCFTVKKKIQLDQPESYTVNVNSWTKRKPKYETKYRRDRLIQVFEMTYSPKNYEGYTPIKSFTGKDHEDLQKNIDEYLENLMKMINEPFKDCSACKGWGVVAHSENPS